MNASRRIALYVLGFLLLEALLIAFIDRPVSEALRNVDAQHPAIIDFFRAWTDYAKSKWYLWPSALGLLICAVAMRLPSLKKKLRQKFRQAGEFLVFLFVCVALSGIVTDIIKPILGRARPVELAREGLYGFHPLTFDARWNSFPSGHAASAFAFAFAVTEFFPRLRTPVFILAAAFGLSRVMVNAHYVADVLAGAAVAGLVFLALRRLWRHNGIFHMVNSIFPIDGRKRAR